MIGPQVDVGWQETRFWRTVVLCEHATSRIGEHYTDCAVCCWVWRGARNPRGYGRMRYVLGHGEETYAYRVAWFFAHACQNPGHGVEVIHGCGNASCCNPSHLEAAVHARNMGDMAQRGRAAAVARGRHGGARPRKLTWEKVEEIRELAATHRYTQREIGQRFGVSVQMVSGILCGRAWVQASEHEGDSNARM